MRFRPDCEGNSRVALPVEGQGPRFVDRTKTIHGSGRGTGYCASIRENGLRDLKHSKKCRLPQIGHCIVIEQLCGNPGSQQFQWRA